MGRLSDYINGAKRSAFLDRTTRGRSAGVSSAISGTADATDVQVSGLLENQEMFEHLLTSEPGFDKEIRTLIKKALKKARGNLSKDAKDFIKDDPRKAARAVKYSVYKQLFGGNLSILQKRKAGAKYELRRQRKLDQNPKQRGGNRRKRSPRTNQIDTYYGADRGFILRFLASGTDTRNTRYGDRGNIRRSDWFGHTAPWEMETASENIANAINDYIKNVSNG